MLTQVWHTLFRRKMIIFNTDLDNTIIYSYKHDIGDDKINVELYQGREISYVSSKTHELLQKVKNEIIVIPTTTRTIEQYNRIELGVGAFKYALTCNGGVLLVDGNRDEEWYKESLELAKPSEEAIRVAYKVLENDERRYFELRYIEELFLFTKCREPETIVEDLKKVCDLDLVNVFNNGDKVYVVPNNLSKGNAIRRIREKLKADYIVAAGDSEFDISMVTEADKGLVPKGFGKEFGVDDNLIEIETGLFSEELLSVVLKTAKEYKETLTNCL